MTPARLSVFLRLAELFAGDLSCLGRHRESRSMLVGSQLVNYCRRNCTVRSPLSNFVRWLTKVRKKNKQPELVVAASGQSERINGDCIKALRHCDRGMDHACHTKTKRRNESAIFLLRVSF